MLATLLLMLAPLLAAPPAKPLTHWATRDWQVFCGLPVGDRLSVYTRNIRAKNDFDRMSWLANKHLPAPFGCVPDGTQGKVLGEMARLVDHFDAWPIRPNLPVFDLEGPRVYRLYVQDIDVAAKVETPNAAEIPLADAALAVVTDPDEVFGARVSPDHVRYVLAHELTHVMQRSSTLWRTSPPVSVDDHEDDWVSEGMADAVGLHYLAKTGNGRIRPAGGQDIVHNPVGSRPYHWPLPITEPRYGTVAPLEKEAIRELHPYRTSSFWRYLHERLGGGDPAWFAPLLQRTAPTWPDKRNTHWIRWLDEGLRQQAGQSLSRTFGAFLPEYLSWGFSRFAGWGYPGAKGKRPEYSPEKWMARGFGGCKSVAVTPEATGEVTFDKVAAMSGRCLIVAIKASGYQYAGLDIISEPQPPEVATGLTLGLSRALGQSTWDCYGQTERRAVRDCAQTARLLKPENGLQRVTWTVQPQRVDAHDQLFVYLTLASFPESHDARWLDRTDEIKLRVGVRAARLDAKTPTTRADQVPLVAPLSAGLSGLSARGVRPGLPVDAASHAGSGLGWFGAMMGNTMALGTTGLPSDLPIDGPAGLPGLTVLAWQDAEPVPDQIHLLVFGAPVPLGFEGRTAAALSSNLELAAAPPRMGTPGERSAIPVDVQFTADRLAMRFETPLCIADLAAIGQNPTAESIKRFMCAERGSVAADVVVPFGEFYVLGSAAPLDPASVTWTEDGPGGAPADAVDGGDTRGADDPTPAAVDAAAAALPPCACTCERLAQHVAAMRGVGEEAQVILEAMSPADFAAKAEADEDPLPLELRTRMQALERFDSCMDRCGEDFARCD